MPTASDALVLIAVAAGGAAAAAIDLRTRRVPNVLSLTIAMTRRRPGCGGDGSRSRDRRRRGMRHRRALHAAGPHLWRNRGRGREAARRVGNLARASGNCDGVSGDGRRRRRDGGSDCCPSTPGRTGRQPVRVRTGDCRRRLRGRCRRVMVRTGAARLTRQGKGHDMARLRIFLVLVLALTAGGAFAFGDISIHPAGAGARRRDRDAAGHRRGREPRARRRGAARGRPHRRVAGELGSGRRLPSADEVVGRGVIEPIVQNEPILPAKLAPKGAGAGLPPVDSGRHARAVGARQRRRRRRRLRAARHPRRRGRDREPDAAADRRDLEGRPDERAGAGGGHEDRAATPRMASRFRSAS